MSCGMSATAIFPASGPEDELAVWLALQAGDTRKTNASKAAIVAMPGRVRRIFGESGVSRVRMELVSKMAS